MKRIRKSIADKVAENYGIYDTKVYRYTYKYLPDRVIYRRLRREYLNTPKAYTEWEDVEVEE